MTKMYNELADWWHLISDPADYLEEAEFFLPLFAPITARSSPTLLELGSGGGNNAYHMKSAFASMTLVDLSPQMLAVSQQINPECEHYQGDMRTIRLDRTFDGVFVHDAIDYMTTLDDLRKAMETAFIHCKPDGIAVFVPDDMRETFESSTDHGGNDGNGRAVRFMEWSYDPDPTDTIYITEYIFVLREGNQPTVVEHDQHTLGLFSLDDWLTLLRETGFMVEFVVDSYSRHIYIARKPAV